MSANNQPTINPPLDQTASDQNQNGATSEPGASNLIPSTPMSNPSRSTRRIVARRLTRGTRSSNQSGNAANPLSTPTSSSNSTSSHSSSDKSSITSDMTATTHSTPLSSPGSEGEPPVHHSQSVPSLPHAIHGLDENGNRMRHPVSLPRLGGDHHPHLTVASVRRRLFDDGEPVDHEKNKRLARELLEDMAREDKRKYNFDFQKGVPLPERDASSQPSSTKVNESPEKKAKQLEDEDEVLVGGEATASSSSSGGGEATDKAGSSVEVQQQQPRYEWMPVGTSS